LRNELIEKRNSSKGPASAGLLFFVIGIVSWLRRRPRVNFFVRIRIFVSVVLLAAVLPHLKRVTQTRENPLVAL
jgi:hypothetical protein